MPEERVILVDGSDSPVGTEEKTRCHLPDGRLHRAFTALLFDGDGRLILARRAAEKMLWPGCWDGTFASHPREDETYVSSGERRMPEELGVAGSLDYLHKFEYHVPYGDVGSENEVCGTLIGVVEDPGKIACVRGEIEEVKAVGPSELLEEIGRDPKAYCPWMLIALELLERSEAGALERHAETLAGWTGDADMHAGLQKAIRRHLPDDRWRLLDEED